jgi:hypothetical protein
VGFVSVSFVPLRSPYFNATTGPETSHEILRNLIERQITRPIKLAAEPGLRVSPIAIGGRTREAEHVGRFID